jgi:hypothetical protein
MPPDSTNVWALVESVNSILKSMALHANYLASKSSRELEQRRCLFFCIAELAK